MKKIFQLILFFMVHTHFSLGQIALEVNHYRPTGALGDAMKPTVSFELDYVKDFESFFRFRAGVNAVFLNSRLDTIPTYSTIWDPNSTTYPGWQTFDAYRIYTVAIGGDFRFFEHDKITPYIGLDATFGYIRYVIQYESALSFGGDQGNLIHYGIRPRAGVEFNVSDSFILFAQFTRNMFSVRGVGPYGYNSYGIGARLNIW